MSAPGRPKSATLRMSMVQVQRGSLVTVARATDTEKAEVDVDAIVKDLQEKVVGMQAFWRQLSLAIMHVVVSAAADSNE